MRLNIYFAKHKDTLYVAAEDVDSDRQRETFHPIESVRKAYKVLRSGGHSVEQVYIVPYTTR